MPSSDITGLTALATPQPTMLMYAAISPFNATDDRSITANALLSTITASITDKSLEFDDGQPTATVSAIGKGKIRYNNLTGTFQQSISGAAYVDIGGGGGGTPGAPLNSVQYNAGAGVFGGNAGFLYDPTVSPEITITAQANGHQAVRVIAAAAPTTPVMRLQNSGATTLIEFDPSLGGTLTQTFEGISIATTDVKNVGMGVWANNNTGLNATYYAYAGTAGTQYTRMQAIGTGSANANFFNVPLSGSLTASSASTGGLSIVVDVAAPIVFVTGGHAFTDEKGRFDAAGLTLGKASSITGALNLARSTSAFLTTIQAGAAVAARVYTWPTDFGSAGSVLTDAAGNGTLSWAAAGGSVTWDAIGNPVGNQSLTMATTTTTWTWGNVSGNPFTITNGNNDPNSGVMLSINTPGGSNTKQPLLITARGATSLSIDAGGTVSLPSGTNSQRLGASASVNTTDSVGIGNNVQVQGNSSVAIGKSANAASNNDTIVGFQSVSGAGNGTGIGYQSRCGNGTFGGVAVGYQANSSHTVSIALGALATTTAANQLVIGADGAPISTAYIGNGVTDATPGAITLNATGGSGTDIAGAIFNLAAGRSTGNAAPGRLHLQAGALATGSGTTAQTLIDRQILGATKVVANNTTTTIVNVTDASNTNASGIIDYCVEVFDGTNLQVETGSFIYQVINKGGAFSDNTITQPTGYPKTAQTSGTLTVTWTITGANPALIQLNANSSLTPSTGYPRVTYTLRNLTQQAVAPQ